MIRVVIESPYAGDVERNKRYLNLIMRDCILTRNEAPFASHGLYTQCLDDDILIERALGINAGYAYQDIAEKVVVYVDFGISKGMKEGIRNAERLDVPIEYRTLPVSLLATLVE